MINREEFKEKLSALNAEKRNAEMKLYQFIKDYLSSLPFKEGDEINIRGFGECWIRSIKFVSYGAVNLEVFLKKLNGEKSKVYRSLWNINVEDIEVKS